MFDFTGSNGRRNYDDGFLDFQFEMRQSHFCQNFEMSWNERLQKTTSTRMTTTNSPCIDTDCLQLLLRGLLRNVREEKVLGLCVWERERVKVGESLCACAREKLQSERERERKRFALSLLHCTIISCSAINSISLSLSHSLFLSLTCSLLFILWLTHTLSTHALKRSAFSLTHAWTYMQRYEHDKSPLSGTNTHAHPPTRTRTHSHKRAHSHALMHASKHKRAHTLTCDFCFIPVPFLFVRWTKWLIRKL